MSCVYTKQFSNSYTFKYLLDLISKSDVSYMTNFEQMSDNFGYFSRLGIRKSYVSLSAFIRDDKVEMKFRDEQSDTDYSFILDKSKDDLKVLNNAFDTFNDEIKKSKKHKISPNTYVVYGE